MTCWNCTAVFDIKESTFCSHPNPSKICPFCLSCYCNASDEYKQKILDNCPAEFREDLLKDETAANQKLGKILIAAGRITEKQLEEAVSNQSFLDKKLGEILVMLGYITDEELNLYLLGQQWIDSIDLKKHKVDFSLIEKIGPAFCLKFKVIPLELFDIKNEWVLRLVLYDHDRLIDIKQIEELKNVRIIPYKADKTDIERILIKIKKFFEEDNTLVLS